MLLLYIGLLLLSFYLLALLADEFFVPSLEVIAEKLKLSPEMAGATFMAVGSSAPEFFTALFAVFRIDDTAQIGVSTIVGSAIFNILVIIGVSSLFTKSKLQWQPVVRDLFFYAFAIGLLLLTFWDGVITPEEALVFVGMYVLYIFVVSQWQKWLRYETPEVDLYEESTQEKHSFIARSISVLNLFIPRAEERKGKYIFTFTISIILIGLLSHLLVESAAHIGAILQISPVLMGLTVLAIGTSAPDLLSSIIVSRKGKGDMAVSNSVGSNIFDILFGLGAPWIVFFLLNQQAEFTVDNDNLIASVFLLFATVLAVFTLLVLRKWYLGPKAGWVLIGVYVAYVLYNVLQLVGV